MKSKMRFVLKYLICSSILFTFSMTINAQEKLAVSILDSSDFKDSIRSKKVRLVDVRTAAEFEAGAIEYAENVDYFKPVEFRAYFETLNKNQPVYLYCRSGNRSAKAAKILEELGFTTIYDLEKGFLGWPGTNKQLP